MEMSERTTKLLIAGTAISLIVAVVAVILAITSGDSSNEDNAAIKAEVQTQVAALQERARLGQVGGGQAGPAGRAEGAAGEQGVAASRTRS